MPTTITDAVPAFSANPVSDIRALTAYPFMVNALVAGALVGLIAGAVGWFIVLRRETFAAHTLSVMSFPGATAALLVGLPAPLGYIVFSIGSAALLGASRSAGGVRRWGEESSVTGTVQALGIGCGFLFLTHYSGVLSGYDNLLFGDFLGITRTQVVQLAVIAVLVAVFLAAVGRPLLFASVDEAVARAGGVPVAKLSLSFLVVVGLAVAATAQITGALLVFTLLVAPAATAQALTTRIGASLMITVGLAVTTTWAALAVAYFGNLPVGFALTSIAFGAYALVWTGRWLAGRLRAGGAMAAEMA